MRRRDFIKVVAGSVAGSPLAAPAQQLAMPVIGFLNGGSPDSYAPMVAAFRKALTESGYFEGQNVLIEYRWAKEQYDQLPALAADLVRRQVTLIAATSSPSALAAKAATSTIPTAFVVSIDPVEFGLVASLNRPGGNMTGVTVLSADLGAKRVELLHELVPTATIIALLINPTGPIAKPELREVQNGARSLGLRLQVLSVSNEGDVDAALATLVQHQADGLVVSPDPLFNNRRNQIVALAARQRMPAIYSFREFASSGGLMSYGVSLIDAYRQVGIYAGKILKGAKPADLPVQEAVKLDLVINLKTAKALGLAIPPSILARADEVIE